VLWTLSRELELPPSPRAPFSLIPAQLLTHPTQSNTFPDSNIAIATMKGFFYPSVRACNCFVAFRASSVILCIAPYRVDIPVIHTTVHRRVDQKFRKLQRYTVSVKMIIYSEVRCHYVRDARWVWWLEWWQRRNGTESCNCEKFSTKCSKGIATCNVNLYIFPAWLKGANCLFELIWVMCSGWFNP